MTTDRPAPNGGRKQHQDGISDGGIQQMGRACADAGERSDYFPVSCATTGAKPSIAWPEITG